MSRSVLIFFIPVFSCSVTPSIHPDPKEECKNTSTFCQLSRDTGSQEGLKSGREGEVSKVLRKSFCLYSSQNPRGGDCPAPCPSVPTVLKQSGQHTQCLKYKVYLKSHLSFQNFNNFLQNGFATTLRIVEKFKCNFLNILTPLQDRTRVTGKKRNLKTPPRCAAPIQELFS